jgi:uncharacterized RDD family membrane protein YckC
MEASSIAPAGTEAGERPRYGRLRRRIEAIAIDGMVFTVLLMGMIALFSALDITAQAARFAAPLGLLLYEPILVTWTGGTIGHRYRNLRVVDDRTGGNVSIGKSLLRFAIKIVLGLPSLITMFLTRRYQAIQDVLTGSTVQVRDLKNVRLASGHVELSADERKAMPSLTRRVIFIALYTLSIFAALFGVMDLLNDVGILPNPCMRGGSCTPLEYGATMSLGIAGALLPAICLIQGIRGRLWGARIKRSPPDL